MPDRLKLLIQSGNPLLAIQTTDEERAVNLVRGVADELAFPVFEWSMTRGLCTRDERGHESSVAAGAKVAVALEYIEKSVQSAVYVFKDVGPHCKDALVHRKIRDLIDQCMQQSSTMIFIDALALPEEIRRFTVRYELTWPSADDLEDVVRKTFKKIRDRTVATVTASITKRDMEQIVQTLRGLTCREAEVVIGSAIYDDYALSGDDLSHIIEAKRTLLGSAGCLEAIAADFEPDDIGGLENLKTWLRQRRGGFTRDAREFGLESPRGVLMLGVPGCGKSLCAKVVAADWKMPLLRLDPGVLYQKFIGESESQLRQALSQAEAMAPAILWIDEIEKAFASASAASADGGLSKRMFGTLLSWMQDHRHPIFIVATANDISALPPELMRKGRFDEVFFIDLPDREARARILEIHLRRRNRDPDGFDLDKLGEAAEGFTGSELEQAVVSGLFKAFTERKELDNEHVLTEIAKTRPLSTLMAEDIAHLRGWAEGRCVPAD
jgi:SpoVK/Ycf46/Vps4 family AAA+-type ATPase